MPETTSPNDRLAQHAAELGLDYTPDTLRMLRHRRGDQGAREHLEQVAALLAYADFILVEDAAVPFTQQHATQTLNRYAGNYDKAQSAVRRRAGRAVRQAQTALDVRVNRAWSDTIAEEGRVRHARLAGRDFALSGGTLGQRFTAVMSLLGIADLPRERPRIIITRLVSIEMDREFRHPGDQDARTFIKRRAPELPQQLDLYQHRKVFRARVDDVLADCLEQLADHVVEGWEPDPTRASVVERRIVRAMREWRSTHRQAA